VCGRGAMWGMKFFKENECLKSVLYIIKERVLLNYYGNKKDRLLIMPPLIVQKEEIDEIISRIRKGILKLKN
jgi:acetylornithine/succinyldiaminopimelate/putrescine aminotransferase